MDQSTLLIDDLALPVVRPASVADLTEIVRHAASTSGALYPVGGRTKLGVGLPPNRPGVAVDTRGLTQIIDYPARDMTITLQSGVSLAVLSQTLAAEGQRLPIDVPQPEHATIGGAIATNTSGPRRLGSGTLRDYVIGMTAINDRGEETHSGGRVVKNVAGYDLGKLHTGALGTLGIISQVTLKVRPVPETSALLTFGCHDDSLESLLDALHATRTRPMCLDLLSAEAAAEFRIRSGLQVPDRPWIVFLGFEDNEHAVNWQLQQILREVTAAGIQGAEAVAGTATVPVWQSLTESTFRPQSKLTLQAGVLPGRLAAFCRSTLALSPGRRLLHAHAGTGVVHLHQDDLTAEQARDMLKKVSDLAQSSGGYVVVPTCPTAWKRDLPVWGESRPDQWLMREVKRNLDPANLFNPGRLFA